MTEPIRFSLNGCAVEARCRADMTVLEWLRLEALLRGTKEGCAEGDCGACSVLLKRPDPRGRSAFQAANSCIMLMGQLDGASLVTVEGLAAMRTGAQSGHPVQLAMEENGSSQCGFCTPGIVSALAGLLDRQSGSEDADHTLAEDDIHDALAGNLCRCTGYRPIVEAACAAASQQIAPLPDHPVGSPNAVTGEDSSQMLHPATLDELLALLRQHTDATLLAGGTDISLDVAHARARWERVISTRNVTELRNISENADVLTLGAAVTWQEALPFVAEHWPSFATLIRRFGSTQIRSMGTVAGNLATSSPIGDGAPALLALGASLRLASSQDERTLPLDDFFLDYRKNALRPGEIIKAIHIPLTGSELDERRHAAFRVYKLSKRYDQDISTVCGAFSLAFEGDRVAGARIAFGGMAATPMRCTAAADALLGKPLDGATISAAKAAIAGTFKPMSDMRGSAAYRAMAAANLVDRLAHDLSGETVEVMAL
ncbi:MAG: xanthine dehydrogenase small subunit [Ahrensia sp.]|nr:xanthine dehydrogenase small subunit [Ahrensia sp.]